MAQRHQTHSQTVKEAKILMFREQDATIRLTHNLTTFLFPSITMLTTTLQASFRTRLSLVALLSKTLFQLV